MEPAGQKRLARIMKKMRQYLHHTQKSVFEGELSVAKLMALQKEAKEIINEETDYVVFFRIDNKKNVKRECVGLQLDPTEVII
jgi:CRISPR-associated protein Cas2